MSLIVPENYSPPSWMLHFHDGGAGGSRPQKLKDVYDDDDVRMLIKKIAALRKVEPDRLWLWYAVDIKNVREFWGWAVGIIYKVSQFLTAVEITAAYKSLTGIDLEIGRISSELSKDECINLFVKEAEGGVQNVFLPLGVEWQLEGFEVFGTAWSDPPKVPKATCTLKYLQTLESFNIKARTIYARVLDKAELRKLIPAYQGRESIMTGVLPALESKVDVVNCALRYLQIRTAPSVHGADVDTLYQNFKAFEVAPFIKKIHRTTGTMIKMHKQINVDPLVVDTWAKSEVFRKARTSDSLVIWFKSPGDDEPQYSPLTILSDGSLDLKVKVKNITSLDVVKTFISEINKHIIELSSTLETFDLGVLSTHDIPFSQTKIIHINVYVSFKAQKHKRTSLLQVEEALQTPEFKPWLAGAPDANLFVMNYKRINDFASLDNVNYYIAKNLASGKKDGELLSGLRNMFGLEKEEAINTVKEWNQKYSKDDMEAHGFLAKKLFKPASSTVLHTKVTGTGYAVKMDGMTSFAEIQRIQHVLKILFANAFKIQPPAAKLVEPLPKLPGNIAKDLKGVKSILQNVIDSDDDEDDKDINDLIKNQIDNWDDDEDDDGDDGDGEGEEIDRKKLNNVKPVAIQYDAKDPHGVKNIDLLKELKAKDRLLFVHPDRDTVKQMYSKVCQKAAARQPVVMTKSEIQRSKDAFAATNYINYGSTPEKAAENFYACPDVWCPKSRRALSRKQYEELIAAETSPCDDPYDLPILYYKEKEWVSQERFVGFAKPDKHPTQLCMPCCYTKKQKTKEGADESQCTSNQQGNPKYIFGSTKVAEAGRFATLPNSLSKLLGNESNRGGMLKQNAKQFVRQGIQLSLQSFLLVLTEVLDNPTLKTESDIVNAVTQNMTIELFLKLDNGLLCKRFMRFVEPNTIYDQIYWNKFKTWYLRQNVLREIPSASLKAAAYSKPNLKSPTSIRDSKLIMRDYKVWAAYNEFINHLQDNTRTKTHEMLLSLVNLQLNWLNKNGINIMVIEANEHDIYIPKLQSPIRKKYPFVVLIKTGNYYEPLVHYHNISKTEIEKFFAKGPVVDLFISAAPQKVFIAPEYERVKESGKDIAWLVIDYDIHVCGVIVKDPDVFVSFKNDMRLDAVQGSMPICFVSDVSKHTKELDDKGRTYLKKIYETSDVPPLPDTEMDLDMFIDWKEQDDRSSYIGRLQREKSLLDALWNEAVNFINANPKARARLMFLRHVSNPLALAHKKTLIDKLLGDNFYKDIYFALNDSLPVTDEYHNKPCASISSKIDCTGQCQWLITSNGEECKLKLPVDMKKRFVSQLMSELVNPYTPLFYRNLVYTPDHNVVSFTEDEVRAGKLLAFFNKQSSSNIYGLGFVDQRLVRLQKARVNAAQDEFVWSPSNFVKPSAKATKLFPNFSAHPLGEGKFSTEVFYKFMCIVGSSIHENANYTVASLKEVVVNGITSMYQQEDNQQFLKYFNIDEYANLEALLQTMRSDVYLPGDLELHFLSRLFDISIFNIVRKQTDKVTNQKYDYRCFNKIPSPRYYLILERDKKTELNVLMNKEGKYLFVAKDLGASEKEVLKHCKEYRLP
jgi:hypothetical protein